MDIRFHEDDGLLQPDGLPKIVVVSVDGVRFPYETSKTIAELYEQVIKIPKSAIKALEEIKSLGGCMCGRGEWCESCQPSSALNKARNIASEALAPRETASIIQRADIVRYKGHYEDGQLIEDPEGELVAGREYYVLAVDKKTVAIIDHSAPVPIRLTVLKTDVELVRKGERVTHKKSVFEKLATCSCGEVAALERRPDGSYSGTCIKCNEALVA